MVITPVAGTYPMPVPPESDVEEILLLKSVKSDAARKPFTPVVACGMEMAFPVRDRGDENVRGFSRPRVLVAESVYPPAEFPTRRFPYTGAVVSPVPP